MSLSPLAQQLLDAHVAHVLDRLSDKNLPGEIERLVDLVLSHTGKLKLGAVVCKEDVLATAVHYAADMDIAPAIPEMVAEIARELYRHPAHEKATLNDVLADQDFKEITSKYFEMEELRARVLHEAISNPVYAALVSNLLYNGITRYVNDNPLTNNIPGAKSLLKIGKSMIDKTGTNLEAGVKHFIKQNTQTALRDSEDFLLHQMSRDKLEGTLINIWNRIKTQPVSRFRDYVKEDDVEDFFVIGFEFWRRFRKTDYYSDLIGVGVDYFFKKYGKTSLKKLLKELGVTRDMILADAQRFAPRVIAELNKQGIIEEVARAELTRFYDSDAVGKILKGK